MEEQEAHRRSERKRAWSGGGEPVHPEKGIACAGSVLARDSAGSSQGRRSVRRRLLATLVALTAVLGMGTSAARATTAGTTPPLTAATVNNGPGDQSDPHISGSLVSYTSAVSGNSEIRYHDLATGSDAAIPTNGGLDFLSDIAGGTVVYTHLSATSAAIFSYDRATAAPPIELDPRPASNRREPAVGNQTVAWVDLGFFPTPFLPEIVAYDLAAQTATRLTNDLAFDSAPAVGPAGSVIVWTKCDTAGFGCDIWQATSSGAGWTSSQLTGAQGEENIADTNGQVVVYDSMRGGDSDIFWQPVGGGPERRLALPGAQRNPNISGDLVAFESLDLTAPIPNWDLMLYDLASDTVYRLTQNTVDETLNDISVTADGLVRVVYTAQEGTDANVYALSFRLPQRTKLAFASARDGNLEIYSMNPDGSAQTRLTTNSAIDIFPAWSPDGGKIAFVRNRGGNFDIYVMNADGSAQTRLTTDTAIDSHPKWSPDGTKLAFESSRTGNFDIYVMNPDGSAQTRRTTSAGIDLEPDWSPDGAKLAFTSTRDGNAEVYVMSTDGSAQTRLTANAGIDGHPTWSPDGTKVAFQSSRTGNFDIYVMNPDGSAQTRRTTSAGIDLEPDWSPDGAKLAFTSTRDGNVEIYVMAPEGDAQTRLTTNPAIDLSPSWGRVG